MNSNPGRKATPHVLDMRKARACGPNLFAANDPKQLTQAGRDLAASWTGPGDGLEPAGTGLRSPRFHRGGAR